MGCILTFAFAHAVHVVDLVAGDPCRAPGDRNLTVTGRKDRNRSLANHSFTILVSMTVRALATRLSVVACMLVADARDKPSHVKDSIQPLIFDWHASKRQSRTRLSLG